MCSRTPARVITVQPPAAEATLMLGDEPSMRALCAGVMCLDFHPQHPHLLAVGCYDGSVLVYDMRSKVQRPLRIDGGSVCTQAQCSISMTTGV